MRLLLVEDDASLAQELAGLLRRADFAVDICATAAEALEAGLSEPYDAAILDLGLPTGMVSMCWWRGGRRNPGFPC